jgi:hypothetical protein
VALPKIAADLNASFSDIQWEIDAYARVNRSRDGRDRRLGVAYLQPLPALHPHRVADVEAREVGLVGGAV